MATGFCKGMLFAALFVASAQAQHPSIFVTSKDVPALREKANHPEMKRFTDALTARCEHLLGVGPLRPPAKVSTADDRSGHELQRARDAQGRVVSLALAYLLTEKQMYAERALNELWCFADVWTSWVDPFHGDPRFYDLMTGEMCMTAGLAYDWLYSVTTDTQRAKLGKVIVERGLERYLCHTDFEVCPDKAKGWWFKCYHNWNTVCNGGAVVAALALRDEYEPWKEVVGRASSSWVRFFDRLGQEGGWDEGTGYWRYGMRYAVMGLEALRSVTGQGQDIFDRPGLRKTGFFPISFNPGGVPVSFGDSGSLATDPIFYLLGVRYKEPAFIWFQDTYGAPPPAEQEGWPVEALSLLWRPVGQEWQLRSGQAPVLSTATAYQEIGWAVFADALPNPSVLCGFKCGDLGANHTQLDNNICNIWAYGQWLALDLGSGSYTRDYFGPTRWSLYEVKTLGHNGVLIGGKGQEPGTKGRMGPLESGEGYALVAGDATANYADPAIRAAQRTVLFLGHHGIVVVDKIQTEKPLGATLLWHNRNEPSLKNQIATLQTGHGCLDISAWSAVPLKWEKAFDVGRERRSRNVKPDWLIQASAEPAPSQLIVTWLFPRQASAPRAEPPSVSGDANRLQIELAKTRWTFVPGEIGYRIAIRTPSSAPDQTGRPRVDSPEKPPATSPHSE